MCHSDCTKSTVRRALSQKIYLENPGQKQTGECAAKSCNYRSCLLQTAIDGMQELAIVNLVIPDIEKFPKKLRRLTALTSLELCSADPIDCRVTDDPKGTSCAFARALTYLKRLVTLTLGIPQQFPEDTDSERETGSDMEAQIEQGSEAGRNHRLKRNQCTSYTTALFKHFRS